MKRRASFLIYLLIFGGLSSCNLLPQPAPGVVEHANAVQYETVSAFLTETADVTLVATKVVSTPQPLPTNTMTATQTETVVSAPFTRPTLALWSTATPRPNPIVVEQEQDDPIDPIDDQVEELPCNLAQPGRPFDLTVPDDSQFYPGEYFSKTWRLVNAGPCNWTQDYAVVWFSGEDIGVNRVQLIGAEVEAGNAIDLTIDMIAPASPGVYQSNWKLRNHQGELFGIGPNGASPFWVRIVVVPASTATVTPQPPTGTPTPVVFSGASVVLVPDEIVDLDNGEIGSPEKADLQLQILADGGVSLIPLNGARLIPYGSARPEIGDCVQATQYDVPSSLENIPPQTFMCYRTTEGLPGRLYLSSIDIDQNLVNLDFVTWFVP